LRQPAWSAAVAEASRRRSWATATGWRRAGPRHSVGREPKPRRPVGGRPGPWQPVGGRPGPWQPAAREARSQRRSGPALGPQPVGETSTSTVITTDGAGTTRRSGDRHSSGGAASLSKRTSGQPGGRSGGAPARRSRTRRRSMRPGDALPFTTAPSLNFAEGWAPARTRRRPAGAATTSAAECSHNI
jgi:hypothetical protein